MIVLYTCFLFLLRGDLISYFYVVMLFCFGMVSSEILNTRYILVMGVSLIGIIVIRYLIQTPLVCQSSSNGLWSLSLHV